MMLLSCDEQWCLTMIYRVMGEIPFSTSNRKNLSQLLHFEFYDSLPENSDKSRKNTEPCTVLTWCISSLHFLALCLLFEAHS